MSRTNKERVLDTIWAASPGVMTNREIHQATGISSYQQVYLLTQELAGGGWIEAAQRGREWVFWANELTSAQLASIGGTGPGEPFRGPRAAETFVERACQALSAHLGLSLAPGVLPGVPRRFDLVSPDRAVVGSTLYFAPVQRRHLPFAKFALIGEWIWLLDKTRAATKLLVFGYDRDVPLLWLRRYGPLATEVRFYYLDEDGRVEELLED